jgi:DNA-binding response OmpR family regulator
MIGAAAGPPTVLVVEDDGELRETYELWLDGEYEVSSASDVERALEPADSDVDVVLLDHLMPERSGSGVRAELRGRDTTGFAATLRAVDEAQGESS